MPREQSAPESIAPGARRWTLRDALTRALDVAQSEGLRALWFKALGETVYRRLFVLEVALDDPPTLLEASIPLDFSFLTPGDLDDYAAFRPERPAGEAAARLGRGDRCFIARHEGRIVAASWVSTRVAEFEYLGRSLLLSPNEAIRYDSFTSPEFRGRGAIGATRTRLARALREEGVRRIFGSLLPENTPAVRFLAKEKYKTVGKIGYVRLGPWRRDFGPRGL